MGLSRTLRANAAGLRGMYFLIGVNKMGCGTMARCWVYPLIALAAYAGVYGAQPLVAQAVAPATRVIEGDLLQVRGRLDRSARVCVGSERAGVMLRSENLAQLERAHRELGFEYIRFHGIFHDDMHVYREVDGRPVYDWTRVDELYDKLLALGMKPFVELSFMPHDLASGDQTIFYWKANVTPPKDAAKWAALVEAFVTHLQARYGHDRVKDWYFEVWNEPNYEGFWPRADQAAYFRLYDATAAAIKRVSPDYRVGGPATAGAGWVPEFIAHTVQTHAPVDFISTHTYAVRNGFLDADGKADLVLSSDPESITGDVKKVRGQIAASARPGLPLHLTEWSASYSSRDPVHDSYTSAAFVLDKLKHTEGLAASMSYWTYSDLFEENGPPPAAFHGGFGMLSRDNIPKAVYFSYKYLNELGDVELRNRDAHSWLTRRGDDIAALLWDYTPLPQGEGNKAFFRKLHPALNAVPVEVRLQHVRAGKYSLKVFRTGYKKNDAYSSYIEAGLPKDLSAAQIDAMQRQVDDHAESVSEVIVGDDGLFHTTIAERQNDVVLVTLTRQQ